MRSSRAAPAKQPLSLLPSARTVLFKTHAVTSSHSHVTHGSGLRAPNSHLLCSVMLDERFARPHADLRHRSKRSDVRRQGLDSSRSFSVTVLTTLLVTIRPPGCASRRVLSLPKTPVLQLVRCLCRRRASWSAGTSRQTSPCTDRPVSETRGAISLSGLSFASRQYLRTHSPMLRSRHLLQTPLETQTALRGFLWSSCPRLLSSRHLMSLDTNVYPCFELMARNLLYS